MLNSCFIRFLLNAQFGSTNPFGVGLGNFKNYSYFDYPHNIILEAFVELGWIPALIFIGFLIVSFVGLKNSSKHSVINKVFFGIFTFSLINYMVSGDLTSPKELYLLMPIGLNYFISNKNTEMNDVSIKQKLASS